MWAKSSAASPVRSSDALKGPQGIKFGANGALWSAPSKALHTINGSVDTLYVVNPYTGRGCPQPVWMR